MAELKTKETTKSVTDFLDTVEPEVRRNDGFRLLKLFTRATGRQPVLWGSNIIGFGKYHYKSERSRQEGDWMMVGFSPRKAKLSLYVLTGSTEVEALLPKLGKHKAAVGCLYINTLSDIDEAVLEELIQKSFAHMGTLHTEIRS
jgi:hypothetical protein